MTKVNLSGKQPINDPCYRYKMTVPELKTEKKSYIVINFEAVCIDLRRDSALVSQFLSNRFGCTTKLKKGEFYIQKEVTPKDILQELKLFNDYFVICQTCSNPETSFGEDLNEPTSFKCSACGAISIVKEDDTTSKIIKSLKSLKKKKNKRR